MAKRNRFVRQQKILIGLGIGAVASSVMLASALLPGNRPAGQATSLPENLPEQPQNKNQSPIASPSVAAAIKGSMREQAGASNMLSKVAERMEQEARFSVPEQFQGKTIKQAKLSGKEKVIALTFDDGPWPKWTEQILDILKKNNIKATFFMVGEVVQEYPQLAQQVVAEGHAIGNHTWTHPYRQFDEAGASREIDRTAELIYKTTGVKTSLFRPPGGYLTNGLAAYAARQKYVISMWSDDSIDYRRPSPERLAHNVLRDAKPGGIVLMHDGGGNRSHTVEALPEIIRELKKQGYTFVTLPELLELQQKEQAVTAAKPD